MMLFETESISFQLELASYFFVYMFYNQTQIFSPNGSLGFEEKEAPVI